MNGQELEDQVYPQAPGEVWKLGRSSDPNDFVIVLVIVKNRRHPTTIVVTLDAVGYPEAIPGRRARWPIAEHNGWRRIV